MNYNKEVIVLFLLVIAIFTGGWLLRGTNWTAMNHDEDRAPTIVAEALQVVSFCEVTYYYAEPVILFGIDMMARIAEIATARSRTFVCENLRANFTAPSKPLSTELRYLPSDASGIHYYLRIEFFQFSFNPETEQIFLYDAFDGTPHLFGTFR